MLPVDLDTNVFAATPQTYSRSACGTSALISFTSIPTLFSYAEKDLHKAHL